MKYKQHNHNRRIIAVILLMVMMLQMGGKILHHHVQHETIECNDCQQHKVHDGHLMEWHEDDGDCLLCQLLNAPYLENDTVLLTYFSVELSQQCIFYQVLNTENNRYIISLRGPPALLI